MEQTYTTAVFLGASPYSTVAVPLSHLYDENMSMRYALDIKAARKRAKLTQAQLAEKVGVEQPTIQRWEAGKRNPEFENLVDLADALEVHPGELFSDGPEATRPSIKVSEETLTGLMTAMLPLVPSRGMQAADVPAFARVLAYGIELLEGDPSSRTNPAALGVAARAAITRFRDPSPAS